MPAVFPCLYSRRRRRVDGSGVADHVRFTQRNENRSAVRIPGWSRVLAVAVVRNSHSARILVQRFVFLRRRVGIGTLHQGCPLRWPLVPAGFPQIAEFRISGEVFQCAPKLIE